MKDRDSSKIESSSFSFINFNWGEPTAKEPEDLVYPSILDPNLKDYYVEIGQSLGHLISQTKPTFTYRLVEGKVLNLVDFVTGQKKIEIAIVDFNLIEFLSPRDQQLVIIIGRNESKRRNTTKQNKEYKQQVLKGQSFTPSENNYGVISSKIHELQAKHNINIVFLDTPDDLTRFIKNLIKSLNHKTQLVPKIKSFTSESIPMHFENLLLKIPGIGKCVAKAIVKKYKTMFNFYLAISRDDKNELENLVVWDEANGKGRALGKTQADKLKKTFLSTDPSILL